MARDEKEKDRQSVEEYEGDLHADDRAGQNTGPDRQLTRTAYDLKAVHDLLRDLPDDELKQIPVLDEGEQLDLGAVYFDLRHPENGEIRATPDTVAGPDNWYVPKSRVDYELWNRLIGVQDAYRLGPFTDREKRAA